jgi:hypothetical protein
MNRVMPKTGIIKRVGNNTIFMKKIFGILFSLLLLSSVIKAQLATAEVIAMDPQSGSHNYFGVKVTLSQTYNHDVTVTGYIFDDGGGFNANHPFTLTVPTGELTAETPLNFYETDPTASAAVSNIGILYSYAGVTITFEPDECILKFNSAADVNTVLNQLEADYDNYNDDYDSQYPNLTEEQLDDMDEQNEFDEFQKFKDFENIFGGFCSKRAEIENVENTWLANSFTGTDPDDIDLTFDEAENTIFNSSYSFKIGNDVYQLTSSGMYKNGIYQDDGGGNSRIMRNKEGLMFANVLSNMGYRYAGPMVANNYDAMPMTDCKSNKRLKSPPINATSTRKFYQKVAINAIAARTSVKGKIVHYKKQNGNWKRKRAEMAVGVSGPVYSLSCNSIGSKSKTNPNGAGYKKRKSLKVKEWELGTIWKTYNGEVGTSFTASGGYSGTFMLTW